MTKSKSQVLKEEILTEYHSLSVEYMRACLEEMLTQQKLEMIKEIQEYWFDLVVGPKGLKDMCDKFSTYLSKLK